MITAKVKKDRDGLIKDDVYEVEHIDMGQSYTSIYLKNPKEGRNNPFNSVIFDFYEDDIELDIYEDARFNPYLNMF